MSQTDGAALFDRDTQLVGLGIRLAPSTDADRTIGPMRGMRHTSALRYSHDDPDAIVVNSFSKYFSMTGWRLGWLLLPPRLLRAADRVAGNFTVCPPAPAQRAALGAFAESSYAEADAHVGRYAVNRDLLLTGLPRIGISTLAPADGAFYVYAEVSHLSGDSMELTRRLLADVGLAVAPGLDFDPVDGHRWIRFSCAGATEDVREALTRLEAWIGTVPR